MQAQNTSLVLSRIGDIPSRVSEMLQAALTRLLRLSQRERWRRFRSFGPKVPLRIWGSYNLCAREWPASRGILDLTLPPETQPNLPNRIMLCLAGGSEITGPYEMVGGKPVASSWEGIGWGGARVGGPVFGVPVISIVSLYDVAGRVGSIEKRCGSNFLASSPPPMFYSGGPTNT